ncbi:MAG: 3-hydroxyacyl-CoA dehydrogenase NAD-binding domain-containing protein [Rhizobiaceae bacterium]
MAVRIEKPGDVAIVTVENPPVNALSQAVRQGLWDAVEAIDADDDVRAVVLICEGRTFIAGADISEFGKPPLEPHLPQVIARIEAAKKPWVAAIHGTALGGGLEVALGCRWRVAVVSAKLGLPEVTLGIIPGAGGTVRLPRLVPADAAVDMITSGKPVAASRAKTIGLVDAIIDGDLREGAKAFVGAALQDLLPLPLSERSPAPADAAFWTEQQNTIAKRAKGEAAPLKALASVRHATEADFAAAMAFERETFLELRGSDQAKALRHIFFAERAAPRPPEYDGIASRPIRTTAVIGGGTMGAGIAAALRDAGLPVALVERDDAALERGMANLARIYDGSVQRGKLTQAQRDERLAGVEPTTNYASLADVDLVIEAVFEELTVKRAVFEQLDVACRPDAVLATNTSYLDPNAIAAATRHPERVLGLHFFSPANIMKLLEVVPAAATAPDVVATGLALARSLAKIPVLAGVCDGFIGNRILKNNRPVLERLLLSGVRPAEIDAAMRGFGLAMGPFEVQDLSGLDIAGMQRKAARERGEAPFAPIGDRLFEAGRLGQKAGGGWYDYLPGDRTPKPSQAVEAIIAEEGQRRPAKRFEVNDLADCIVFPMIDEGARILEEGIAKRPVDIDLVQIHGYGFPRWRGGLMHYAETRGLSVIVDTLQKMHAAGLVQAPSQRLVEASKSGKF